MVERKIAQGVTMCLAIVVALASDARATDIALEVEFDSGDRLVAQPLWVTCSLVNRSSHDVVVPYSRSRSHNRIEFVIIGPDGSAVAPLRYERRSAGPRGLAIEGGGRHEETFNLYDEYRIVDPGYYSISVRFQSDGEFRALDKATGRLRSEAGWRGTLSADVGAVDIRASEVPEDKAALRHLVSDRTGSTAPYRHLFTDPAKRKSLLEFYGQSSYASVARYFQAMYELKRYRETTNRSFAQEAVRHLAAIERSALRPLFRQKVEAAEGSAGSDP